MNGSVFYGTLGRIISGLSYVSILIVAMQIGGMFQFMPPKVSAFILALGATLTSFSERLQGGASSPKVRHEAAQSDIKNAKENEEIDLNDINC
jgi:hypothetical protein